MTATVMTLEQKMQHCRIEFSDFLQSCGSRCSLGMHLLTQFRARFVNGCKFNQESKLKKLINLKSVSLEKFKSINTYFYIN